MKAANAKPTKLEAWFARNRLERDAAARRVAAMSTNNGTASPSSRGGRPRKTTAASAAKDMTDGRSLRYPDFPLHYTWKPGTGCWEPRQRAARGGEVIGRMYQVSPTNSELYALRLLLLHVPGACSRAELRDGFPTYREAAIARGLWQDSDEAQRTLDEAIETQCSLQ